MDEVQAVERMFFAGDTPVHVHAAFLAGMALDGGILVHNGQAGLVFCDFQLVPGNHGYLGKQGAGGLPAPGAAANMVMCRLGFHRDFHGIRRAMTMQGAAFEFC